VTLTIDGKQTTTDIDQLSEKMKIHMEMIKATPLQVSSDPILVSIQTNDPAMWSVVIVDLPGFENIASDEENEKTVKLLNDMNYKFLRDRLPNDLVVLVKDGRNPISNDFLFNTTEFIDLNLDRSNHIVVVTKVNSEITSKGFGLESNHTLEFEFFKPLEDVFKTDIFYVTTIESNQEEKSKADFSVKAQAEQTREEDNLLH